MKPLQRTFGWAACLAIAYASAMADIHYVDISNPSPLAPYTSEDTAANDIQSAVDAAVDGDTVLVADGTYNITSKIDVMKSVTVKSLHGVEHVVVDAGGHCRAFTLSSSTGRIVLDGLTITGGNADHSVPRGGGIYAYGTSDILITNCIVQNNSAPRNGGGLSIFAGTGESITASVQDCVIRNNSAGYGGGGVQFGTYGTSHFSINNCSVEENVSSGNGGGIYTVVHDSTGGSVTIENCNIAENISYGWGGGIWCGAPGGSADITRCIIQNNYAEKLGGGIRCRSNVLLSDSLITQNRAGERAGGIQGGDDENSFILNCTVVGNDAPFGGGISRTAAFNSIIYGNSADDHADITPNCTAVASCSPSLTNVISGNISAEPQFVNAAAGDYRLLVNSPCIDAGTNGFVLSSSDLEGNARIADGNRDGIDLVDMGAHERVLAEAQLVEGEAWNGAKYLLAVPDDWNGDLAVYAHGYLDAPLPLMIPFEQDQSGELRELLLADGYAVACSSYSKNGFAVLEGTIDTLCLNYYFHKAFGKPERTFLVGHSLGGLVCVRLAEALPGHYDGVLTISGMVGGSQVEVDYMTHVRILFEMQYPGLLPGSIDHVPPGTDLMGEVIYPIISTLSTNGNGAFAVTQIDQAPLAWETGEELVTSFVYALAFWYRGFDDMAERTGTTCFFDNADTVYTSSSPYLPQEHVDLINQYAPRFGSSRRADWYFRRNYEPTGRLRIPMLGIQNSRDPVVPASIHQARYAEKVARWRCSENLVQRTVDRFGHTENFTADEVVGAFEELVEWADTGIKPTP
jgi:pimeloyl-ACP methyl ester carboxylesterase